jgi:hypothetical protein
MAFYIKQNDTSPSVLATLKDANNTPVNLTASNVRIHMTDITGVVKIDSAVEVINAQSGIIRYDWEAADTDTAGTYYVEFEVTYTDGAIETFPNTGKEVVIILPELN